MLDLAKEGLVDTVPNKGFRVTAVSDRRLDEYTHIRSLIEIPTTARLATTADAVALVEQGSLEASAEEHLEILDALLARDEEAVRQVMTRHLGHVRGLWAAPWAPAGVSEAAAPPS